MLLSTVVSSVGSRCWCPYQAQVCVCRGVSGPIIRYEVFVCMFVYIARVCSGLKLGPTGSSCVRGQCPVKRQL